MHLHARGEDDVTEDEAESLARGHLGQRIAVFPEDRLIIVRFGLNEEGGDSWDDVIETVAAKVT
jgi:hypothetical protein